MAAPDRAGRRLADEVGVGDAERIVAAVRRRCGAASGGLPSAGGVRAGIAEVWGAARVPETAGGFTPHVSLAYSDTDGPGERFAAALAATAARSAIVELTAVQAISLGRDGHLCRWDNVATVPLGLHIGSSTWRRSVSPRPPARSPRWPRPHA